MKYLAYKLLLNIWIPLLTLSCYFTAVANDLPSSTLKLVHNITLDASIFYKVEKFFAEFSLIDETDFSTKITARYSTEKPAFIQPDELFLLISSDNVFTGESETRLTIQLNYFF